ncbi:MAG: glycosyltransferase family 2 protein [FCB group bacterium]|nr:glycosyltransferase family 2 protein [FCB group bacterium]
MNAMILIPAYNSASSLPAVLNKLRSYPDHLIVVIDDGSTDGSGDVARNLGATLIRHDVNRGKGAALQSGFAYAAARNMDYVITMDADEQHPPEYIRDLLDMHRHSPDAVLLGTRKRSTEMPFHRKLSNAISAYLISLRAGRKIYDAQCGFRLIPQPYYSWQLSAIRGFIFESEALIALAANNVPFIYVPIPTIYPEGHHSKMTYFDSTFGFIFMYIASFFKTYRQRNHDIR